MDNLITNDELVNKIESCLSIKKTLSCTDAPDMYILMYNLFPITVSASKDTILKTKEKFMDYVRKGYAVDHFGSINFIVD